MSNENIQFDSETLRPNYKTISSQQEPVYTLITDGTENMTIENGAAESIDFPHAEIHEGHSYIATNLFLGVTDNNYADFHIVTGSTKCTHMIMEVVAEGKSYISFYRDTTYTGGEGTAVNIHNLNNTSANTTASSVYHTPTINVLGTLLLEDLIAAGEKSKTVGGVSATRVEWILKPSTDYLLRVQNVSGAASDICIEFTYYELSV